MRTTIIPRIRRDTTSLVDATIYRFYKANARSASWNIRLRQMSQATTIVGTEAQMPQRRE